MPRLRVIIDPPRDPRLNMAIDEAIALKRQSTGVDTLRIYTWLPSAVSIGRRQDALKAVRLARARRHGLVVVKRPSGGLALLHGLGIDLTYSLITSDEGIVAASIEESARAIAEGVVRGLRGLGLNASAMSTASLPGDDVVCLANRGAADVYVGGLKVSGSAQLRRNGVVMQHGSILIRVEARLWLDVLRTRLDADTLLSYVAGIRDVGWNGGLAELTEALVEGFEEALDMRGYLGGLSGEEASLAVELMAGKYSRPGWFYPS